MSCKLAEADWDPVSKAALLGQLDSFGDVNINSGLIPGHYLLVSRVALGAVLGGNNRSKGGSEYLGLF